MQLFSNKTLNGKIYLITLSQLVRGETCQRTTVPEETRLQNCKYPFIFYTMFLCCQEKINVMVTFHYRKGRKRPI